jgi:hypothetical protein
MRFWASGNAARRWRSSRVFYLAILTIVLACSAVSAQAPQAATKKTAARRANELTLAGLRPGRDNSIRATQLYKKPNLKSQIEDAQLSWSDNCQHLSLTLDVDGAKRIQVIRVAQADHLAGNCATASTPETWKTGRGLHVWDEARRVTQLYGEPDSRSPSSKDGKTLELLYYAFDWAGADVPQVMEVLCTKDSAIEPGHVVEITLAAPSL